MPVVHFFHTPRFNGAFSTYSSVLFCVPFSILKVGQLASRVIPGLQPFLLFLLSHVKNRTLGQYCNSIRAMPGAACSEKPNVAVPLLLIFIQRVSEPSFFIFFLTNSL